MKNIHFMIISGSMLAIWAFGCESEQSNNGLECTENEVRCSEDHLGVQVCKDGTWSESEPCGAHQTCDEESKACREPAGSDCKDKETKCASDANGYLTCTNGRWSEDAIACKYGKICSEGNCIEPIVDHECTEGEKQCSEDKRILLICDTNGHWESGTECNEDEICDAEQKECIKTTPESECNLGDKKCSEDSLSVLACNVDGHWEIEKTCESGESCDSELKDCVSAGDEPQCTSGEKMCSEDKQRVLACNADGQWETEKTCGNNEICDSEQKDCITTVVPPECTSGQKKCSGDSGYLTCNTEGHWAAEVTSCKFQETCQDDGQCIKHPDKVDFGIWYSTWYAFTKESSSSNKENTWTAWDIPYRPRLSNGSFGMYDSKDAKETSFFISQISDAGIDFIILDQTNNIDVDGGYINERSLATADECKKFIDSNPGRRPVKYCSAIGGVQFACNPAAIENEAKILWERYNSDEQYHYYVDGKPLLIVYIGNCQDDIWTSYTGDKTYASKFTIRYADNDSMPGNYGWAYDKGTQLHSEVSVIMPGWDNRKGATPVKRNAGDWYQAQFDVLRKAATLPKIIVINSFNEYAEGTAVWSADTNLPNNSDKWVDKSGKLNPDMYWNMTVEFIKEIRK